VLDLDDTLYLERDYVRSGFAAVGQHLADTRGIDGFSKHAWALFEQGARGSVFDQALLALGQEAHEALIAELVDVYRSHQPVIQLCPDAARFLESLPEGTPLALITDGPVASQRAKIEALGLARHFDLLVLSDEWGAEFRKPHERPFATVEAHWPNVPPGSFTYVADNPLKDFVTPKARGWRTVRVQRHDAEHCRRPMSGTYAADETIESLEALNWVANDWSAANIAPGRPPSA